MLLSPRTNSREDLIDTLIVGVYGHSQLIGKALQWRNTIQLLAADQELGFEGTWVALATDTRSPPTQRET